MTESHEINEFNSTAYTTISDEFEVGHNRINRYIQEVLPILDTKDWNCAEDFLRARSELQFTILHLAAYSGRLDLLKRADALKVDLYLPDNTGRSALHWAVSQGHVDVVRWLLERSTPDRLRCQDCGGWTALHLAVALQRVDVVKLLVDARADVYIRDHGGRSPFQLASVNVTRDDPEKISRYEKIVSILLGSVDFEKLSFTDSFREQLTDRIVAFWTMVFDSAVLLNSVEVTRQLLERGLDVPENPNEIQAHTTPLHLAAYHGAYQTLCTLLEYQPVTFWMINMRDKQGRTPLQIAIRQGKLKCAQALIINGGSLASTGKDGLTVVDNLFRYNEHPMAFLRNILDTGVSINERDANTVTLDFEILAPEHKRQMAVVSDLIRGIPNMGQMNILQHPVVEAFLGLKWSRFRYFFIVYVFLRALFVACLYVYSIVLLQRGESDSPLARRMLCVFAGILLCHNIVQLAMIPRYYAKQFDKWLSIISTTICMVVTVVEELRLNSVTAAYYSERSENPIQREKPSPWILQSISVAILFACLQVMLLIGRFPTWGHYALMFTTVLKNVSKVLLAFIWIIVGFAFSFTLLFHGDGDFNNPWNAFVKTAVMMMGEYEYSNLYPLDKENLVGNETGTSFKNLTTAETENTFLPFTSRIMFLLFVVLTSIVLMNLMIGLAVTDIQELLNKGLILRLLKQAEFVAHLERVTTHWIFRNCLMPKFLADKLKSINTIRIRMDLGVSAKYGKRPRGISEKLVKELFELVSKNKNPRKKFQSTSSCPEDVEYLTETILRMQEVVEKLQQKKIRIQEV